MRTHLSASSILVSLLCIIFIVTGCGGQTVSPPVKIVPSIIPTPISSNPEPTPVASQPSIIPTPISSNPEPTLAVSQPTEPLSQPTAVSTLAFADIIGLMTQEHARAQTYITKLETDANAIPMEPDQLNATIATYTNAQTTFNSWTCKMIAELDSGNAEYFNTGNTGAQSVVVMDAQGAVNASETFIHAVDLVEHPLPTPVPGRGRQNAGEHFVPIDVVGLVDSILQNGIDVWKTLNEASAAQRAQMRADLGSQIWANFDGSTVNPCP